MHSRTLEEEELFRGRAQRLVCSPPGRVTVAITITMTITIIQPLYPLGHNNVPRMRAGLGYASVFTVAPRGAERRY